MDVIHGLRELPPDGSAVTIGFFDGVHRGHQDVIRRTVQEGRARGLRPVAVTFDRHPREVLTPGNVPLLLTSLRRKAELIDEVGIDALVVLKFDEAFSRWSPEDFVSRVLAHALHTELAVVGENFTFGHKAAGTFEVLGRLGEQHGFSVEGVTLFEIDGRPVSSTSIREALVAGDLDWPERALGRRYIVDGTVVPGAGRGADLGFATANLRTPAGILLPGEGVYAGRAYLADRTWAAAINIGTNPTFGGEPLHLEAHLLDFDEDIQGQVLSVELWERLRDEMKFDSPKALAAQIRQDVDRTRELLGKPGA
ncbi:MAG: bifunctional riboflavin kinase/FAD synthetase [Actinomycetota bacterium]